MRTILWGILIGSAFLGTPVGLAQSGDPVNDLRKDLEDIKQAQRAIQRDLETVKNLLLAGRSDTFQGGVLSIKGAPFRGNKNAKVTIIEFSDYQCPFCTRSFQQIMPQLVTDYVNVGKVKYVLRDFPLEAAHPAAFRAAEAARCAG